MKAYRRSEVRTREERFFFYKNTENAVKINNSPRFTVFTKKRCKKYAVKIIFFTAFHRISYDDSPPYLEPGIMKKRQCKKLSSHMQIMRKLVQIIFIFAIWSFSRKIMQDLVRKLFNTVHRRARSRKITFEIRLELVPGDNCESVNENQLMFLWIIWIREKKMNSSLNSFALSILLPWT